MADNKRSLTTRIAGLFRRQEKSPTGWGWPLPITGGYLPFNIGKNFNWWQQGYDPVQGGRNPTVAACIAAYAQTMASLRANHIRLDGKGGKTIVETSALSRVLRRPNEYQTRSDLILNLISQLLHEGNAYAVCRRNDRMEISELHIIPSRSTQPMWDEESGSIFYSLGTENPLAGDMTALIPARDVMHVRLYTPRHPLMGVSPISNLGATLMANDAIAMHQGMFFTNMSRPSGLITTDQALNRDQLAQLRAAWDNQSSGMNSGQVPILGGGMKWQSMSLSSEDAQTISAYRLGVEDIARAFRVPPPLIGDLTHATYNNTEQLVSAWLAQGLGFMLEHVEGAFSRMFALQPSDQLELDTDSLLRTDFAGRIDALTKGVSGGLYSPNEARRKEGLPEVAHGAEPRVQAQVVPLSQVAMANSAPTPAAAPVSDEVANPPEPLDDDTGKVVALHAIKGMINERHG